jgi:hypothetical protein
VALDRELHACAAGNHVDQADPTLAGLEYAGLLDMQFQECRPLCRLPAARVGFDGIEVQRAIEDGIERARAVLESGDAAKLRDRWVTRSQELHTDG